MYALQKQRYRVWLHHSLLKKQQVVKTNSGTTQVAAGVTQVGAGVTMSSQVIATVAGPEKVSMLNVDLNSANLRIGVVQADNRLISPAATVSSMANSSGAIAGVNGDFYEIGGPNVPIGEEIINGHLLHSPNPHFMAVLGVTSSGRLTIGAESFSGSVSDRNASYPLYSINHYSEFNNGYLLLFTPDLGASVYVGGDPVAIIQPLAGSPDSYTVQSVSSGAAWLPALAGREALLGSGDAGYWLANTLHQGDHIKVTGQITPDGHLYQAIGGGPQLVKNGALFYDPNPPAPQETYTRNPQTAIGLTKDGSHALLAVFDGRLSDTIGSRGMTQREVALFMLAHGSYNVMLFDSGGSSEMVARLPGQHRVSIINWPADGYERRIANALFIYSVDLIQTMTADFHRSRMKGLYADGSGSTVDK